MDLSSTGYSSITSLSHRALSGYVNLGLHGIAMNALRSLGSDEQIAKWGQLGKNFQIIATYAQTELGHGELELLHSVFRLHNFRGPIHSSQMCMLIWKHPSR